MERLHKQGFSGVGEDVKKRLRLLSEERLSPREEKPCGFVRHFHFLFKMKMAEEVGFEPTEGRPSAVFKTAALNHSTILPRTLLKCHAKCLFFVKEGCKILIPVIHYRNTSGRMVEWFKAAVLKTAEGQLSEGSNPSFSAIFMLKSPQTVPFSTV